MLKFRKSEPCNCPVLVMEAKGRFRVKVLPEIEPLNMFPAVPVAKVVTVLAAKA